MRDLVQSLGKNMVYGHFDFMEKLPIPISGSQTSEQFHGAQRKTLSVFGAYFVLRDAAGKRSKKAIILVSEVIELSALFGSMCVLECLKHVEGIGALKQLVLGFDTGTHFRSYENLYYFLFLVARKFKQSLCLHLVV